VSLQRESVACDLVSVTVPEELETHEGERASTQTTVLDEGTKTTTETPRDVLYYCIGLFLLLLW
jgi:hypothetical protein